jgi:hypothetical protein
MVDVILTTLALQMLLVWAYHNRGRFVTAAAGNPESASESTSDAFDHVREAIKGNLDPEAGLAAFEVWLQLLPPKLHAVSQFDPEIIFVFCQNSVNRHGHCNFAKPFFKFYPLSKLNFNLIL